MDEIPKNYYVRISISIPLATEVAQTPATAAELNEETLSAEANANPVAQQQKKAPNFGINLLLKVVRLQATQHMQEKSGHALA